MNSCVKMMLNAQNLILIILNVKKTQNMAIILIQMMEYIKLAIKIVKNVMALEIKKIIIVQNASKL